MDIDLNPLEAAEIINEAKAAGGYDGSLPEDDDAKVELAKDIVGDVHDVWVNDNMRGDDLKRILSLARIEELESGIWGQDERPEPSGSSHRDEVDASSDHEPEEEVAERESAGEPAGESDLDAKKLLGGPSIAKMEKDIAERQANEEPAENLREVFDRQTTIGDKVRSAIEDREFALAATRKHGLPEPADIPEDDVPTMPFDLTELGDDELMSLHSRFNACLASAQWSLGLHTIDEQAHKNIAEHLVTINQRAVDYYDGGKKKPDKVIEGELREAASDDDILTHREESRRHRAAATALEKLARIYDKNVDVISRQWAYRESQLESSGNLRTKNR